MKLNIEKNNEDQILVIDRFEDNIAVCENVENGEMVDIDRNLITKDAIEGMRIKKVGEKYIIDYENCIVFRKMIIDKLKVNWNKEENVKYYIVSSILENALKCSNIYFKENIIIKNEELINKVKKGDIIRFINGQYVVDEIKNEEVQNEILQFIANFRIS